jgi:hypothetical protein
MTRPDGRVMTAADVLGGQRGSGAMSVVVYRGRGN